MQKVKDMSVCVVLQGCVWAILLWPAWGALGYPLDCKDEQGSISRCSSISLEKLLDRVIQHAELIYRVSEESCTLFEEMFVPFTMHSQKIRGSSSCVTKAFPIPGSKSEIQQISDKWLLHSVLMLVQSWMEPLVYLQTTLDRYDDAPDTLLNKTKWVSDKLPSLEQGIVVLIRKMLDEGMLTSDYQLTLGHYDVQPEVVESVLRDYALLTCFKKDAHKMETFLKLLKCRRTDKLSCFLF
ncbi:somatolactin-like [Lepisosteus oculatus]|uniref:Somatolactin beta n=1 Tax=Lepisosteus oculatus TaxID=7918 RepID=W5M3J3_LEPOC|nr:PREDICTED: somatolactin-like [Lepisosteus oculatus]